MPKDPADKLFEDLGQRLRWWHNEWSLTPFEIMGVISLLLTWVQEGNLDPDDEEEIIDQDDE